MLSKFWSCATRVSNQILGISALITILFIAGCASGGGSASLAVTTTSGQLATVVISSAYPQTTLVAANGTAPYTWTVSGGALPTGMALSSAGVLSGTPTAFGTFSFTVTVTDSATPTPHTAIASLNVMVNPAITSVALNPTTVTGGTASTATVTLSGAAAAAASVTLASNNAAATVPATVTVTAGSDNGYIPGNDDRGQRVRIGNNYGDLWCGQDSNVGSESSDGYIHRSGSYNRNRRHGFHRDRNVKRTSSDRRRQCNAFQR
jgi:hypothetical protein